MNNLTSAGTFPHPIVMVGTDNLVDLPVRKLEDGIYNAIFLFLPKDCH